MNKELLEKYCNNGLTIQAISRNENISCTAIRYWLRKFGLRTKGWSNINKDELIVAIRDSESYNEVFGKLNRTSTSGNYKLLKRLILKFNIDVSHFLNTSELMIRLHSQKKIPIEDILVANSRTSRATVKKIILDNKLLEYVCCECGQHDVWLGKKMTLILDHINGINNDHRLENLRFVCPNCNSTLPTHCRKNKNALVA